MISWLRYQLAWWKWAFFWPPPYDERYGTTRAERRATLRRLYENHSAREPKREDYGL